ALEGLEQGLDLPLPAIELLRDPELAGPVVTAERERRDLPGLRPLPEALHEVGLEPAGALVTLLRRLLEEPHHHVGEGPGDLLDDALVRRGRRAGDVAVDELDRVVRREGED